eukprot:Phypoly_transcript_12741.p1 GENE.Phypoly_transcript_12741~~Phypoly_transcript_12741.p1  ORF type:complete len:353 (+),score=95.75 Phypoly_transcript_12741:79-1059(+)
MAGDLDQSQEELPRAFWAIELVPGKEYNTVLPFDLHITSAVLPFSAKDTGRSVVTLTFADEKDKTFSIVSLDLAHASQTLKVVLDEESDVTFSVHGKNPVHLSGYYTNENPEDIYGDGDSEIDSDEVGDDELEGLDSDDSVDEDIDEATMAKVVAMQNQQKRKALSNGEESNKKPKTNTPQQQQQNKPNQNKATPNKPQQQEKKPQTPQQQQKPQQKELQNGLKYTVIQEGTGAIAAKGKKVGVKYVGKLTKNNKVFDASKNKPFVFNLGRSEVIKGWDLGVAGMKVGEKRVLVIPPELGYGREGAGREIPPNSSLTFEVELVHVN